MVGCLFLSGGCVLTRLDIGSMGFWYNTFNEFKKNGTRYEMVITTAGRVTSVLVEKAKRLSVAYGIPYIERGGASVNALRGELQDDIVVVGKNQLFVSPKSGGTPLHFHPNLAMIRAKRFFKGEDDTFISAAKLEEGMSVLDCTLGFASDSILASLAVGEHGSVTGIEGNRLLHLLDQEGLATFSSGNQRLDEAMRRIQVVYGNHDAFLSQAEDNAFDVVYFDPMFQTTIDASNGMNTIRELALKTDVTPALISEAKRVASKRIILKDHWKSDRFAQLGFTQHRRKTSLFHYGTIELEEC